ncbi:hypothetical protein GCM10007385_40150 [Tateyamaria omphalii]|uniref:energy transducer TonB family protein n=1 Tax=Tateyamaria omphalii TaxID=299262 RepID=UPI0016765B6F|nr:energy transducer TonB [Tateyamaria omphalii]GGX67051.1 hypothetical protein GCM10007385_40150 [Tateyamaria omphalii]
MIAASRTVAVVTVVLAAVFHLGGLVRLDLVQPVQMDGGQAGATEASLGSAFADLAQGTLTGVETTEVTEPVNVEDTTETSEPIDDTVDPTPPEMIQSADTDARVEEQGTKNLPPRAEPDQTTASAVVPEMAQVPTPTLQMTPSVSEPLMTPERLTMLQPLSPVEPAARVPTEAVAPLDTLTADETDQIDLAQSRRPKVRSRAFEDRNKPNDPPPAPRQTKQTASRTPEREVPRGNQAQTNARAGAADGTAARAAPKATGNAVAARAGTAAASNYPGEIMRKLQRARRPRVGDRGVATVSFRIASNGGLSAVSVARSSGSRDLDNAAMQVIRGAAPFPAPPPGAQRSFSIQIKGR